MRTKTSLPLATVQRLLTLAPPPGYPPPRRRQPLPVQKRRQAYWERCQLERTSKNSKASVHPIRRTVHQRMAETMADSGQHELPSTLLALLAQAMWQTTSFFQRPRSATARPDLAAMIGLRKHA